MNLNQKMRPFGTNMNFYSIEPDGSVLITRIRHSHEDWQTGFRRVEAAKV